MTPASVFYRSNPHAAFGKKIPGMYIAIWAVPWYNYYEINCEKG